LQKPFGVVRDATQGSRRFRAIDRCPSSALHDEGRKPCEHRETLLAAGIMLAISAVTTLPRRPQLHEVDLVAFSGTPSL
jgi:hypothetical protein